MLRRSFFKAAGVALAVLAAAYVPGRPWEALGRLSPVRYMPGRGDGRPIFAPTQNIVRGKIASVFREWPTGGPNDPLRRT